MQKLIGVLFAAGLMVFASTSCVNESDSSRLKVGTIIPPFTVNGPDGTFSSSNFTNKGGLLVFFASYCSTCHEVLPKIEELWEASDNGQLFSLAALSRQGVYDEDKESVADYWEEKEFTMPYYLDFNGEVYYQFAKETIPRIYVIDKDRKIAYMSVGNKDVTAEEIAKELEKALGIEIDLP